tara:strand:- start:1106 stop:1675 length:570 start_codon:yes stop_codon:yes gene_type:complete
MLIVSQNLVNYDVSLPDNVVYRINLAWISDLDTLISILEKFEKNDIFLDLPKNRTKPPNNRYSMDELKPIIEKYSNIKYFAISNIDSYDDLLPFLEYIKKGITLVPKIESPKGVNNIKEISESLGSKKIVMLDHDDLFSSMLKLKEDPNNFQNYIKTLIEFCNKNDVTLLRTIGVVFADDEKRISEYIS